MRVEIRDSRFVDIIGSSLTFECLGDSFLFIEGPVWDSARQRLLFSDIPGNAIYEWSRAKGIEEFRRPQQGERIDVGPRRSAPELRAHQQPRDAAGGGWANNSDRQRVPRTRT